MIIGKQDSDSHWVLKWVVLFPGSRPAFRSWHYVRQTTESWTGPGNDFRFCVYCHYVASYICTTCPPQRIGSTVTSSYWPGWSTDWREYRSISYPWHKPFWTFLSRITFLLTATSACLYYIMQWLYDLCYCWKYTIVAPTQILVGEIYSNVRVKHADLGFVFSGLY